MAAPKIAGLTTMQIEGLESLRELFTGEMTRNKVKNLLRGTTFGIARRMRDRAKERVKKDSHDLENSIYAVRRRGSEFVVYSDVRARGTPHAHALMLENGTRKTPAQPYVTPTVQEMRGQVPTIYRNEFGKRLVTAMAKSAKKVI